MKADGRCVVSKIDGENDFPEKKESILNRVVEYASRLVA
jgi:hypothetical protein